MKTKNFIFKGILALAVALSFSQCANNQNNATPAPAANNEEVANANLRIAFVEIDSLLTKYNFCKDLNELMLQKEENIRTTLNEKAKKLENEMDDRHNS